MDIFLQLFTHTRRDTETQADKAASQPDRQTESPRDGETERQRRRDGATERRRDRETETEGRRDRETEPGSRQAGHFSKRVSRKNPVPKLCPGFVETRSRPGRALCVEAGGCLKRSASSKASHRLTSFRPQLLDQQEINTVARRLKSRFLDHMPCWRPWRPLLRLYYHRLKHGMAPAATTVSQ